MWFGCGVFARAGVSLSCWLGAVVASVRAGLAVVVPLGVFVVFVLVGSCRVVVSSPVCGCFVSAARASLLLFRLRCLRASRRRAVAAAAAAALSSRVAAVVAASRRVAALLASAPVRRVLSRPSPLSFPPAVWSPPSPSFRVAVVALLWRSRCPAGGSVPCSRCPFALVSLPAVASACGVSVRSLFSVPALFSLPSVPVSWCSCLLSGRRCVSLRGLLPPGFSG